MANINSVWKGFYVLEGLDGSGTTSQLHLLLKAFAERGIPAAGTWEPSDLPVGLLIRRILRKELRVEPETLARLFSTDRFEHLYNETRGIRALLDRGQKVFCDRYLFSSLAYQSLGCGYETVRALNDFPLPEKLFFVDVPPEICRDRRHQRDMEELFEDMSFQEQLLANYRRALEDYRDTGMEIHIIDGTGTPEEVREEILGKLL